ncbi:RNA cap guanine-N2 methyltransferase-domain-containing protein [Gloeopeniophorella convolvens]|nr:RNA cap guanine-N2 methyltransferase-domain-containing protein [Gloeopeniophorella convolvens]
MGKKLRQSNLSGLSRFLQVLDETASSSIATSSTLGPSASHTSGPEVTTAEQPHKKRKTGLLGPGNDAYDATGLVPFYTDASQVPAHLQKYFAQRARYFKRYDEGCLLDEEGWYSVTPEAIADQIAERCRCDVILDGFCGVGGNAIAFARTCERVIALDTSPTRLALARHNAALHGLAARIEFVLADFREFVRALHARGGRHIDVVFLSPPWGGPEYLAGAEYTLARTQPEPGAELFQLARLLTPNVAFYVPRNTVLADIAALLPPPGTAQDGGGGGEQVEVEEEWMGNKLKALTCYFGGLATGQEHLF